MLLAVPGCPTSNKPRSPANVTTHRSTSAREPTNFGSMTIDLGASAGSSAEAGARIAAPRVPHKKSTTRPGERSQPGGRGDGIDCAKEGELIRVPFLRRRLLYRPEAAWPEEQSGSGAASSDDFFLGHAYFVFFRRFTSS